MRKILIKSLIISLVVFLLTPVLSEASNLFVRRNDGKFIILSDSSEWLVHPSWQRYSRSWNPYDKVAVHTAMNPQGSHKYVLVKNYEPYGVLAQYSEYPLAYRHINRSYDPSHYLWKEKWRRDDRMWNLLNVFLLSKQLKAEQKQSQQEQKRYKEERRKPQQRRRIVNIDETLVVHITRKGNFFHKKTDCPFLKEVCKNPKVNPIGTTVKRAKEAGCSPCPHCFRE